MSDPFEIPAIPLPPMLDLISFPEHCSLQDGAITAFALAGTPPYQFSLDSLLWQSGTDFIGLSAGTYSVYLRDSNYCTSSGTIIIDNATSPEVLSLSVSPSGCGQANGEISVDASGGSGPLLFALNGGSFTPNPVFTGLPAGSHTVSVRDTASCVADTIVTVGTLEGPVIEDIKVTHAHCGLADGSIVVTASVSSGIPEFSIDNDIWYTSPVFSTMKAGTYDISIRDENGCVSTASVLIDEIPAVQIELLNTGNATCNEHNGSIQVLPDNAFVTGYAILGDSFQVSPTFDNLASGTYSIVLQSHGVCYDTAMTSIIQHGLPVIDSISVQTADCTGKNGTISVSASGGVGMLIYTVDGLPSQQHGFFDHLDAGVYSVFVTDSVGCFSTVDISISRERGIRVDALEITPADCGVMNGAVEFALTSEHLPVEVFLDEKAMGGITLFTGLPAGRHILHIEDDAGCTYDSILFIPSYGCQVFIPNVFSPNGDGINDLFEPVTNDPGFEISSFEIWNRWGNTVFSCTGIQCAWDGGSQHSKAPADVYVYRIVFNTSQRLADERTGSITLIR
jgi:gliding motility-associated-like protein